MVPVRLAPEQRMNYLIEGLSGTGKSTVCKELQRRGYRAIEADEAFGFYGDPKTGQPTQDKSQLNWIWDKNKVDRALQPSDETIFVCGGSVNQDEFTHYFTQSFVLYVDDDTLRNRLLHRTGNDFGKHPTDLARQLEWNQGVIAYAQQRNLILVDATKTISHVVDEILLEAKP